MFFGATPGPVRDYLASELKRIAPKNVFEPCAGNFVLSMVCGAINKDIRVVSGDVSLYSAAIGHAFANQDGGIRLKPELLEQHPFFKDKTSPVEIGASVIYWAELAKHLEKQHVRYYAALVRDLTENVEKYFKEILGKVEKARASLTTKFEFKAQDAAITIQDVGPGDFVTYDPPYYMGDYEKEYKALCTCFDAPPVPFTEITPDLRKEQLRFLNERGAKTFFRCEEVPEIEGYKVVFDYIYKADGKKYFVMTNTDARPAQGWRTVLPTRKARYNVLWDADLKSGMKAEVIPVNSAIGNHYRQLWTKKALMRDAGEKFLLSVGGMVCGVISIMSADRYGHQNACIVADAAPLNTPYRRLGKLVLHSILNHEFMDLINKRMMWEHTGYTTLAYTDNPVSMKYRGLFELADRQKGGPAGHKFTLTYRTTREKLRWRTIQEAYEAWFKQHAADVRETKNVRD